eukprot:2625309-Amphidinium_carterae.1
MEGRVFQHQPAKELVIMGCATRQLQGATVNRTKGHTHSHNSLGPWRDVVHESAIIRVSCLGEAESSAKHPQETME